VRGSNCGGGGSSLNGMGVAHLLLLKELPSNIGPKPQVRLVAAATTGSMYMNSSGWRRRGINEIMEIKLDWPGVPGTSHAD